MLYIRFYGYIPFTGSMYEDFLAFDEDTPIEFIDKQAKELALEIAKRFSYIRHELGLTKPEFSQQCINQCHWQTITKEEFNNAIS